MAMQPRFVCNCGVWESRTKFSTSHHGAGGPVISCPTPSANTIRSRSTEIHRVATPQGMAQNGMALNFDTSHMGMVLWPRVYNALPSTSAKRAPQTRLTIKPRHPMQRACTTTSVLQALGGSQYRSC